MTEKNKGLTFRGQEAFLENPFITRSLTNQKTVKKRILGNKAGGLMVVNTEDQSEVAPVSGFWASQVVDQSKFVKLYKNGVRQFKGLAGAGFQVFEILYDEIQNNIGKGTVFMSFKMLDKNLYPISEQTFQRGIRELITKDFIARAPTDGVFWVNPDYIFNGDRLAFVEEWFKEGSPAAKEYLIRKRNLEAAQNQPELALGMPDTPTNAPGSDAGPSLTETSPSPAPSASAPQ
jgi:hypothetical protein